VEEAPAIEPESRAGASVVRDPATGRGVLTGAGVEEVMAAEGGSCVSRLVVSLRLY
jgi:hypothetical protein